MATSRISSRLAMFATLFVPVFATLLIAAPLQAALTITPTTWNVVGLDSNDPLNGPNRFPIGARVCSDAATTNVDVAFVWDSANPYVDLRAGSLSTLSFGSIAAGSCVDAYFEAEVQRTAAAFDTARRFHIEATDASGTVSTPTPRELFVEHLISQSRNAITDVKIGPNPSSLTSVPPGGAMSLLVGNTYTIQLAGGTATQGYNQFEAFINFSNTVFQILDVETTYSANDSPWVSGPAPAIHEYLYADACRWENDPNSPNYRACVGGDYKAGGSNVVTTYTIKVIGGGGTSESLGTLLYDFSGSSYHYNADYSTGARIANVIDPAAASIAKTFGPNPAALDGVSVLTITLTNPNAGTVAGYNFVDNLPANMLVASSPAASTSGCGTPTLVASPGSSSITFSNGTLAANSTCVVRVNITPTALGTLTNTTGSLFIDALDTGKTATASLEVTAETPGVGFCGVTLAAWNFTSYATDPPAPAPSTQSPSVATAAISVGNGLTKTPDATAAGGNPAPGMKTYGWAKLPPIATATSPWVEIAVDTSNFSAVVLSFNAQRKANGPDNAVLYYSTDGSTWTQKATFAPTTAWTNYGPYDFTGQANTTGVTYFRVYAYGANATSSGNDLSFDNIVVTGCGEAIEPTIAKSFSPDPIAVNAVSTLTFVMTNPNSVALTGAKFLDSLPAGVQVAAAPSASTTCGGTPSWAPLPGATSLAFGQITGATIPAGSSCTVTVAVTASTAGAHSNVSGFLSTTEGGTASESIATDTLTAILPPAISKQFAPAPILAGGTSTLTFTLTNPNQDHSLLGVAFSDALPAAPGAMTVAALPGASTSGCGAPTFAPSPGATTIAFSGGTIAPGATCIVTVDVTAPIVGTYANATGNVSHVVNTQTVFGGTATDSLEVVPPSPSLSLLKQVGTTASGPWLNSAAVDAGSIYYRFTIENSGDVPLSNLTLSDATLDVTSCNASLSGLTLPVAVAANDNHIFTCVVGPVAVTSGLHVNTASAQGTYGGTSYESEDATASWATASLTLDKSAAEGSFTLAGDEIHYSYSVTNSGFATLAGPVTVSDDKVAVTCPELSTIGDLDHFFDAGESLVCTATYTVTASDIALASVTNIATASADSATSNSDSVTVPLPGGPSVDVSMSKTLDTGGPFTVGDSITYTLLIANAGPSAANGIDVTDTPSNLTITTVSGACATLPCTIASLAPGANTTITVTATIDADGAFDNSATATPDETDSDPTNNTDSTGNGGTAGASVDVSMSKTLDTAGPFTVGESITFTLLIANAGPSTATSIDVTDAPSNLTITNVSGACGTLPCTIASLASGANTTITVTATIDADGAFDNSATATPDETDSDPTNNTDSTGNGGTAGASVDVSMSKTLDTAGPFTVGDSITYTLLIANAGPSTANGIDVTDTPSNLTITTVSGACATLPCTIASLAPGANTTITVTATIDADGAFDNSATATPDETDSDPTNNTDSTGNGGTAGASVDVSMSKTLDTAGPFTVGDSITYTLLIANAGPSTATSIHVTDTPSNLTITNVSGACATLPCTIATLASGANTTITVTATIDADGAFDNSATATPDETDSDPTNNTDSTGNGGTAGASVDVSMSKTLDTAGPFTVGDSITYTLLIANAGPSTANGIDVTDTPSNLTITNVSGACATLPCTIASLAPGANTTITVTATIDADGAFDNSATATPDETDSDPTNNTDSTGNGGTAGASVDVSMSKTLDTAGPFTVGDSITFTLLIANAGPSTANGIDVTDTPSNLTITNVSGACATLPCTIATLASGANTTITVTATIDADGAFDNSATATPDETDSDPSNNTDSTGNGGTAGASVDVSMSKTLDTPGPFTVGDSITYTLLIANAGPSTATGIDVTDTPSNLTITTVSGACATLPCTIASLASGANTTITVTATIDSDGAFDNAATATPDETDSDPTNNTDSTGNGGNAGASVDVSLVKTLDTAGPFTVGDSITFTLLIANAGPSTATSIDVTDTPSNMTITNVSGACATLPCTIASLASGANTTITVTAAIDADGAFDNSATATPDETDSDPTNNTDSTGNGGNAGASVDVSLVKTLDTAGPFTVGDSITFTLLVANAGPSTATSIDVTDTPSTLTITTVSGACATLPCTIASLAPGANTTITVTATIDADGAFDNSATATPDETDSDPSNNTDSTGNGGTAGASVDVSLVKTLDTAGPFTVGDSITFTLLIANAGPSTATSIDVTDTPSNLTITNVSGACVALPCTIATLASGANTSIIVTATIDADGAFDNSATATPDETDSDPTNNTDSTGNGGNAGASVDVSLVKTLDTAGPFTVGDSITFTLLIANAGPSTATGIDVTDTPSNLTITNVSGACATLPCTITSLASGANTTITVTATIEADDAFDNSATATPDEIDSDPSNNTDSTGNGGTAGASVDVSLVKTLDTVGPFTVGDSITYTLLIANAGPSTATGIDVTDTPSNLTITNVSGACVALPCTIATLASGANTSIIVTATIDADGAFDNSATATPDETDSDPSNNTDSTGNGSTAGSLVDVSLVKTLDTAGPFTVGDSITFTLLIANAGPSTATSIDVTDTPSNLTITNVGGACATLPCTIASLASGANTTITVTATIDADGAFDNSATATPDETDSDPTNNTDSTGNGGNAGPSVDVSLVKTLDTAGPFTVGDSITFTLLIANAGPSTATSIDVTDTPSNLTITTVSGACATLPCTIASLASGANTTITVTATIDSDGAFDNAATATPDETDSDPSNNTDSTGNGGTAGASVDVSLVKTLDTVGPFTVGDSVTYTLLIANAGPSTATSIDVTDTPSNLTITNVSGACATLPCTIASLASGANTSITVTATIDADGAFDNSATATPDETDSDPTNNTDSTGNGGNAGASVDVSLVKTLDTAGPFTVGDSITFTLLIANAGPSTATSIDVTDTPSNLTITNVSGACATLPCTIATLASGANTSITVTATIDADGAFDNSATATPDETDSDPSNNTDSTGNGGTAGSLVDVSLVKTLDTAGPFTVGDSITYTLLIANAGPSTATSIDVTDTPSNLTITNVSGACATLPCTIATLASGANTSITVNATIDADGAFDNSATATPDEIDSDPSNNTDSTGNGGTAGSVVDVSIVTTLDTPGPFTAGDTVTVTLLVANAGPSTATSIDVTDTPSNLTIANVSGACTALPCTIASLAAGVDTTITFTATIDAEGAFGDSASAIADEFDVDMTNNTDSDGAVTEGAVAVDLAIDKQASETSLTVGQTFSFTLVVTNLGPDAASGVVVTDPLPMNFVADSVESTRGTCSGTTTVTCNVGTMLNGESVTITITGRPTAPGTLMNTATVISNETETVMTNNSSTAAPAAAPLPAAVPTATEWGLMILAAMLAFAGAMKLRLS